MSIETLAFENTLLRCGLEAARIGMCVLDHQETVLLMTERFAQACGVEVDQLLGQSQRLLLSAGLQLRDFERVFGSGAPETASEGEIIAGGERRNLLFEGRSFPYARQVFRVVSVLEITDFGITRDRLIELRRKADALRAAVVITDACSPDQPIVYVSPQFFELTGYRPSEAIGRNGRFLQGAGTEPEALAQVRTAIAHQRTCSVILTNYRKDGSSFRNELTISPLTGRRGEVSHFLAIQRALTSRDPLGASLGY